MKEARCGRKQIICFHLNETLENANLSLGMESRPVVAQGGGGERCRGYRQDGGVTEGPKKHLEVIEMLATQIVVAWAYTNVKTYQIVHF